MLYPRIIIFNKSYLLLLLFPFQVVYHLIFRLFLFLRLTALVLSRKKNLLLRNRPILFYLKSILKFIWNPMDSAKIYASCEFWLSKWKNWTVDAFCFHCTMGHLVWNQQVKKKPQKIQRQKYSLECKNKTKMFTQYQLRQSLFGENLRIRRISEQGNGKLWCLWTSLQGLFG